VELTDNTAISDGGGIYMETCSGYLENIIIMNNSSEGDGGGLVLKGVDVTMVNVLIHNNIAGDDGGGFYCSSGSTCLLSNFTIMNNSSTDKGGGIYCSSATPSLFNSIVAENEGDSGIYVAAGDDPLVTYCNFYNNEEDNFHGFDNDTGVISTINRNGEECDEFYNLQYEPGFVFGSNSFILDDDSVLINAGSDDVTFLPETDLAGNPRVYGEYVDIGAYENQNVAVIGTQQHNIPFAEVTLSNYPNPFNPSTTISFSVPQTALFATIEIYNIKGQKVKTLECSNSFAAHAEDSRFDYSVIWNGCDENMKPVSSGIYFARLKAGKTEASCKMLLLK